MSRPALRLVEPLNDAMDFPEGKSDSLGIREIAQVEDIHSHLQLFLMWPEYSSCFIKISGEMVKANLSVDQGLREFDQMFITLDEPSFLKIKSNHKRRA